MANVFRWAGLVAGAAAAASAAVGAVWATKDVPVQMGARATGARMERMRRSPQFRDGKFHNSVPSSLAELDYRKMLREFLRRDPVRTPSHAVPVVTAAPVPAETGLHVTWLGHATALVEIEGRRVLLDPVWSDRCSPSALVGPKRLHPVPYPLTALPEIDAVVISHDHYDHLDMPTVRALTRHQSAPFLVPLGIGAHLQRWGVPEARIIELDWDESATVSAVTFTITAARHFSGRGFSRDETLWGSWVIKGENRRLFYTGDTGYFDGFARIGAEHGPFDATLVQVGAYGEMWPDIHMTPEDGVRAHVDVGGGLMIPVHWCTWVLAFHAWGEPVDRVWREAKAHDVHLAIPRPGQRVDVDNPPEVDGWWVTVAANPEAA
jgi:L-ascorbate metabolism protein UlaG (beta-lactamase superfamily)